MSACGKLGYLLIGGKKAGLVKCTEPEGHDERRFEQYFRTHPSELDYYTKPTPHRFTLEWTDDVAMLEDWPDAYDREERFDVEVPIVDVGTYPDEPVRHPDLVTPPAHIWEALTRTIERGRE